ncbi:hypothetical protein BC567DRAFT_237902 [Phyllosticta citribraziliensis]
MRKRRMCSRVPSMRNGKFSIDGTTIVVLSRQGKLGWPLCSRRPVCICHHAVFLLLVNVSCSLGLQRQLGETLQPRHGRSVHWFRRLGAHCWATNLGLGRWFRRLGAHCRETSLLGRRSLRWCSSIICRCGWNASMASGRRRMSRVVVGWTAVVVRCRRIVVVGRLRKSAVMVWRRRAPLLVRRRNSRRCGGSLVLTRHLCFLAPTSTLLSQGPTRRVDGAPCTWCVSNA